MGSGPAWLESWLSTHSGDVVGWRRSLHAIPELGGDEFRSTEMVAGCSPVPDSR